MYRYRQEGNTFIQKLEIIPAKGKLIEVVYRPQQGVIRAGHAHPSHSLPDVSQVFAPDLRELLGTQGIVVIVVSQSDPAYVGDDQALDTHTAQLGYIGHQVMVTGENRIQQVDAMLAGRSRYRQLIRRPHHVAIGRKPPIAVKREDVLILKNQATTVGRTVVRQPAEPISSAESTIRRQPERPPACIASLLPADQRYDAAFDSTLLEVLQDGDYLIVSGQPDKLWKNERWSLYAHKETKV